MSSTSSAPELVAPLVESLQRLPEGQVGEFFHNRKELVTRSTVEDLTREATRLLRIDLELSRRLSEASLWLSEQLDDDYSRAKAHRAAANLAHAQGRHTEALERYRRARSLFELIGNQEEAAITASSSLQALTYVGDHEAAFAEAKFARTTFERVGDRLRLARLNFNYANILHHRDRWAEAAGHYEDAYRDFLEIGEKEDVAVCLGNMAVCHQKQQDFVQALAFYERTREFCEENGLTVLVADIDYNIAYLYYLRGEYTRALELYREARVKHRELGDRHHEDLCALDEAEIYLELNLTVESADLAGSAFDGFQQRGLVHESARALTNLALAEGRQGKSFLALELLGQARDLYSQNENHVSAALVDLYKAGVLYRAGRPFEARSFASQAGCGFGEAGLATKQAACELLLTRISLDDGDLTAAAKHSQSVLEKLSLVDAPSLSHLAYLLLGEIEERLGNAVGAKEALTQSHEQLERIRGPMQTEEQKVGFLDDQLVVYESLVSVILQGDDSSEEKEEAFAWAEKAKSRSLANLLAFRAHLLPATSPGRSKLADQVRQLREELNWYYRQINLQEMRSDAPSTEGVEALRAYSRQQEGRLIRTLSQFQQDDQEFRSLQEGLTTDLETIRRDLSWGTTLLEYYVARGTVYALIVDHRTIEIVPLTLEKTVRGLSGLLRSALSRRRDTSDLRHRKESAAFEYLAALYEELVAPVHDLLRGPSLVVIPHSLLFYLPFHAFPTGSGYLADEFTVSYAPSATVFHLSKIKDPSDDATGTVFFCPDDTRTDLLELAAAIKRLEPDTELIPGQQATGEALQARASKARFIYLSAQGHYREDNPMFSSLEMGGGSIHLFDLFQLHLRADVVSLLGCGPGLNTQGKGDEVVGLVRGLLYAGARSVVTTVWDVEDSTAAEFSSAFHRHLQNGESKALATSLAITELRSRHPDPYHWAGFALYGEA